MTTHTYQRNRNDLYLDQAYAYQCDMLVWHSGQGLGALSHPGHASLVLRRDMNRGLWYSDARGYDGRKMVPELEPATYRYVSFWPGEMQGYFDRSNARFYPDHFVDYANELGARAKEHLGGGAAPRPGQIVIGTDWQGNDVWGQKHQAVVSLPGLTSALRDRLGLDLNRIVDWTVAFRNSGDFSYIFVSKNKNCAGVAVNAMRAGGADAFTPLGGNPAKPSLYILPNDAERWAEAVVRGILACNRMLAELRNRTRFMAHLPLAPELMSAEEWKKNSHVPRAIRGRLTSHIDTALKEFHRASWAQEFPAKLAALVTIIKNVHDHLREDSKRDAAYLLLSAQVMSVVNWLGDQATQTPWNATNIYKFNNDDVEGKGKGKP